MALPGWRDALAGARSDGVGLDMVIPAAFGRGSAWARDIAHLQWVFRNRVRAESLVAVAVAPVLYASQVACSESRCAAERNALCERHRLVRLRGRMVEDCERVAGGSFVRVLEAADQRRGRAGRTIAERC